VIHLLALLGIVSISFSAVFIRLALVSPVTATFFRGADAIPVLALIWWFGRARDHRRSADRILAFVSGLFFAADLNLWHESITFVGAGLGTVIPNVQIVFVTLVAWTYYGERPSRRTLAMMAIVLIGLTLTSGLSRPDAYGSHPARGVALGIASGLCYSLFLLIFRASNRGLAPPAGPLLDATTGTVAGALLSIGFDPHFTFVLGGQAHLWLLLLALVAQVLGWLCIANALPRLPAIETSVLLLFQPACAILWGALLFGERLSTLQWSGSVVALAGVAGLSYSSRS
jgi:drug/metabolite transporter (DMT)-like permease